MSTPKYKGPGQPTPDASGLGWLGGFLGGASVPPYKTTPTPTPVPPAPPTCPPCPTSKLVVQQSGDACDAEAVPTAVDEYGDSVIPVGAGPITIVINPRA